MPNLEGNKRTVISFCEMIFNDCRPAEVIASFAGADYVQHNPHVLSGKQGFIDYFEKMTAAYPGKRIDIKRAFADGNHVILHCHQIWPQGLEYAGIGIYRLDNRGKIVEHWDELQEMPTESAHDNGMF